MVIDDDGLILTNSHVVENATSNQIQFYGDDERYAARVLRRDRLTDSALLELVERPARKLELRGGKVTRGVIGVQIGEVPSDDDQVLGLDALRGVIVSTVALDGPADEAGIESGDVIVAYGPVP